MDYSHLCGHVILPKEIDRIQGMQPHPNLFAAMGPAKPKRVTTLLHKYLIDLLGYYPVLFQETGDCTAFGAAGAVDVLKAVEILLAGEFEDFKGLTCTELIYAISRVTIGQNYFRGQQGSSGAWTAQAVKEYGTVVRGKYGDVDVTKYSGARANDWGDNGAPRSLIELAKEHNVQNIAQVRTADELCLAIENGYPVTIASNQGFSGHRDQNGFSEPQGSWPHQMFIAAVRYDIDGALVINSWGAWNSGPKVLDQPDGSFWVRLDILEDLILRSGDCWSFATFKGFEPRELPLIWA